MNSLSDAVLKRSILSPQSLLSQKASLSSHAYYKSENCVATTFVFDINEKQQQLTFTRSEFLVVVLLLSLAFCQKQKGV